MDNIVTGYPHQHTGKLGRQLTVISKPYDLDGKGQLDEIQQAYSSWSFPWDSLLEAATKLGISSRYFSYYVLFEI